MDTNSRVVYPIPFFDGGLNTKNSSHVIGDNESGDNLNCELTLGGAVRTRYGTTAVTHNTLATGSWWGLTTFQPSGASNSQIIGFYNSSMMYMSGVTWVTVPSADGVFQGNTNVVNTSYLGYLFCGDGSTPYKWNGSNFTRMGVEVPSAPNATTGAAGSLTGTYGYKITYVNSSLIEGDVGSSVTVTLGATSSVVSLNAIPTAVQSYGINRRNIYRTKAGGTVYFYLDTITNNTATTYSDSIPDSSLITAAPTDQGRPPNFNSIKIHKDRAFAVDGTSVVKYSEIGLPFTFKVTSTQNIGKGDGIIRALGTQSDSLVCVKNTNEIWLLYLSNNDPTQWFPIKANCQYGSGAGFNLNIDNEFFFLGCLKENPIGYVGLIGVNPANETISTDIGQTTSDILSDRIEPEIFKMNKNALARLQGIVWKNRAYITYASGSSTTANMIWQYDFRRRTLPSQIGAWLPWSGIAPSYFTISDNKLLASTISSSGSGQLIQLDRANVWSDSGSAINSYYETKFYGGRDQDQINHKDFRWLYLWVGLLGGWNMDLIRRSDFTSDYGDISRINLNSSATNWGILLWGQNWNTGFTETEAVVDLGKTNGRRIKFRFSNQNVAGQAFQVNRGNFEYILRTRRRNSV